MNAQFVKTSSSLPEDFILAEAKDKARAIRDSAGNYGRVTVMELVEAGDITKKGEEEFSIEAWPLSRCAAQCYLPADNNTAGLPPHHRAEGPSTQ